MYNQYSNWGQQSGMAYQGQYPPVPQIPKLTKALTQQIIANVLGASVDVLKFERVTELPTEWKHACYQPGVAILPQKTINYPTGEIITFALCTVCGKVHYHVDI